MTLMRWNVFIPALLISAAMAVPQNMIGCGPMMEPHDYYASFLSKEMIEDKGAQPFFYTSLLDFYDDWSEEETVSEVNENIVAEWQQYAGNKVSREDAAHLVYKTNTAEMKQLITALKTPATALSPQLKNNSMAQALLKEKKAEALQYLLLAKTIEPFCTTPDQWSDAPPRDSLKINGYLTQANNGFTKTTDPFLKNRYAFQRVKLAFYNNRLKDCVSWYDATFDNANQTAVQPLAFSYKAGALFRMGKGAEAAYSFSRLFAKATPADKKKIFLGFLWSTDRCNPALIEKYTALAPNQKEKAYETAMFGLFGEAWQLSILQKTYALDPSCELLPLLAMREMNKLEERYLTPHIEKQEGSKAFYLSWYERDSILPGDEHVLACIASFGQMAKDEQVKNTALFATGVAYLQYMRGDYASAQKSLTDASGMQRNAAIKDQQQLIGLLIKTSELKQLDAAAEQALLPSLQWLQQKAIRDSRENDYRLFYRNYFSQVLAPIYFRQGEFHKAALAYGLADRSGVADTSSSHYSGSGIDYMRNEMNTASIEKLYAYLNNSSSSAFEKFVIKNNGIRNDDVIDMMGTTHLRDFDFAKAIEWMQHSPQSPKLINESYNWKTDKTTKTNINPFHDYLNDWQRHEKPATKPFTKLSFAKQMLSIERSLDTMKNNEQLAKTYYQLASAYYNMSYYGNSWEVVAYYRPTTAWNSGQYKADWEKEFYGVHKAKAYYQKAYELTGNKEFKAAAFFMVAKCAQRQVPRPDYDWENYDQWEVNIKKFQAKFHDNPLFPQFKKEFGTTKFYQYAFSRCSYLRDFAKKR